MCWLKFEKVQFREAGLNSIKFDDKKIKSKNQKLVLPYPQFITFAIVSRCFENKNTMNVVKQKCHLFVK